jgi:hypothetical protein
MFPQAQAGSAEAFKGSGLARDILQPTPQGEGLSVSLRGPAEVIRRLEVLAQEPQGLRSVF